MFKKFKRNKEVKITMVTTQKSLRGKPKGGRRRGRRAISTFRNSTQTRALRRKSSKRSQIRKRNGRQVSMSIRAGEKIYKNY
jgi:hypothetical protein